MKTLRKWNLFMLIIVFMLTIFTVPVNAEIRSKKTKVKTPEKTTVILFVNTKTRLKNTKVKRASDIAALKKIIETQILQ